MDRVAYWQTQKDLWRRIQNEEHPVVHILYATDSEHCLGGVRKIDVISVSKYTSQH